MYKNFDYIQFAKEFNSGDLNGLEYLEKTIIKNCKDYLDSIDYLKQADFTREEYIYNLFQATKYLNFCNNIYETSNVKNNFNFDTYSIVRNKLFEELEIDKVFEDWSII